MLSTSILATIGSLFVGGAVAAVTVVSLVHAQTAAPSNSPANVKQPVSVTYGS